MSHLLIDDQGEVWRGESRQLRAAFDSPFSGGEFVEYAVKNLGFVAVNLYGRSIQVRLRPTFVTPKALCGLRDWMQSAKIDRMVLSRFERGWQDELIQAAQIGASLDAMLPASGRERHEDYLAKPLAAAALEAQPVLAQIIDNWRYLVNEYETDSLIRLLRSVFGERYVIVKHRPDRDKLLFQEFGDKMFANYEIWRTCAIGAPISEQPDRGFGRWVADTYRTALTADQPVVDIVDAIIRCPESGRSRRRYRRLIFPISKGSSEQLIVGGSFEDSTIDLRLLTR